MLSDRSYMRDDYPRQTTSVLTWLMCTIVAGFVLQNVFWKWLGPSAGRSFDLLIALSPQGLISGKLWTLVTYSLLHSMSSFLHVVFNLLWIYLLGKELLPILNTRRFLWLYGGGVFLGGALWLIVHWNQGGLLVGASAGVCALLMVYAALNPNRSITLLLFFIVPVTIKPKWLVMFLLGFDLLGLFFRFVHHRQSSESGSGGVAMELPGWLKRSKKRPVEASAYKVNVGNSAPKSSSAPRHVDLREEVDRILDKINVHGFGSLTDEEKKILDRAKDSLNQR